MALFYRRDDDVQNGLGEAVPNIAVTYYSQPSLTPATIYYDPAGTMPAPNPQYTNGLGQTAAYMAAGLYTITYVGEQIQTLTYPDQLVGPGTGGGGATIVKQIPTPAPDGTIRVFTIPGTTPSNPVNDMFFVAGSYVPYTDGYTVSGNTITWVGAVPPQTGDSLAYYVTS
jgi:hypothetical protein